jgi:hypothetical protein
MGLMESSTHLFCIVSLLLAFGLIYSGGWCRPCSSICLVLLEIGKPRMVIGLFGNYAIFNNSVKNAFVCLAFRGH